MFSKREAEEYAKTKSQVSLENLPENISQPALDLLVDRQYEKKKRQSVINSNPSAWGSGFAGNLAGSLLDPISVAAGFIPFVGEARYASMLAKASGPIARAGVRLGVGAIEGAAGNAILEPLNYSMSQKLQDDYTFTNSLMNIGMGGVVGGGMHMGAGAVGDAFAKYGSTKAAVDMAQPRGVVAQEVNQMSEAARGDMLKAAIAQGVEGKHIEIGAVADMHRYQQQAQIENLRTKMNEAFSTGDKTTAARIETKISEMEAEAKLDPIDNVKAENDLRAKAMEPPDSKFVDNERIQNHEAQIANNREATISPEDTNSRLTLETERTNEAVQSLTEKYQAMKMDTTPIFKEADEAISRAAEYEKAAKIMTICALRGES